MLKELKSRFSSVRKFVFYIMLFSFHFSLFTFHVLAQTPTQEWVVNVLGPTNDLIGPFLQVDKQGNSYIAGTHVVNDTINILCAKYNTLGVQLWATVYKYPGEGFFTPTGLALDTFGNAYVACRYALNSFQPPNSLTVKFNASNGAVVWAKKYIGQLGRSYPLDIKIDRTNNIYVAGWSDSSHLIIKYDINGDSVWIRKYNLPGTRDMAYACTIDDSLNIIITGIREYCVTFPPPGGCFDTLLAAKYSSDGALRWIRTYRYNSNSATTGLKVVADQNCNVYIGGSTAVSGYLTLKYDRNGTYQWSKIYDAPGNGLNSLNAIEMDTVNSYLYTTGGSVTNGTSFATTIKYNITNGDSIWVRRDTGIYRNGGASDILLDTLGNSYITGSTNNFPSGSAADVLTIRYSPQGNIQWFTTYNGPFSGTDGGRALSLDTALNVYVLGYSQTSSTVSDYVLIKYSQFLGIQPVNNKIPVVFKLCQNFPNPFNPFTKIRLSIPKKSFIRIIIYDILGRIKEIPVNQQLLPSEYELTVDATDYASGTYFYLLIADGNIIDTKKFIVLK